MYYLMSTSNLEILERFELPTRGFEDRCSNPLSYRTIYLKLLRMGTS